MKRVLGFLALGGVAPALADAGGGLGGAMSTVSWMGRGVCRSSNKARHFARRIEHFGL